MEFSLPSLRHLVSGFRWPSLTWLAKEDEEVELKGDKEVEAMVDQEVEVNGDKEVEATADKEEEATADKEEEVKGDKDVEAKWQKESESEARGDRNQKLSTEGGVSKAREERHGQVDTQLETNKVGLEEEFDKDNQELDANKFDKEVEAVKEVEREINKLDEKDEVTKIGKGAEVNMDDEEFDANIASRETNMKGNGGDFDDDFVAIIARENSFEIFGESQNLNEDLTLDEEGETLSADEKPGLNNTIDIIWVEMNRRAEVEMAEERDKLVEELLADLDDTEEVNRSDREVEINMFDKEAEAIKEGKDVNMDYDEGDVPLVEELIDEDLEGTITREQSFEIVEDANANENKIEDKHLEEERENEADVHFHCRLAGQECGGVEAETEGLLREDASAIAMVDTMSVVELVDKKPLVDVVEVLRYPKKYLKVNIQNEAVENIEDTAAIGVDKKGVTSSRKRKAQESISANVSESRRNGRKRCKTETIDESGAGISKQTGGVIKVETRSRSKKRMDAGKVDQEDKVKDNTKIATRSGLKKTKKKVVWTRSSTKVSIGGTEEKVMTYLVLFFSLSDFRSY